LELAGHPAGIGRGPAGGRLAHQDLAVVAQVDDRRHRRRPVAERQGRDHAVALGSRGRVRRSEVDAEVVSHSVSSGADRPAALVVSPTATSADPPERTGSTLAAGGGDPVETRPATTDRVYRYGSPASPHARRPTASHTA